MISGEVFSTVINGIKAKKIEEAIYLAKRYQQPVYIEIPRDVIDKDCHKNTIIQKASLSSDYDILNEGLDEIVSKLNQAKKPAILAGVEIHRFKLEDELLKFANQYQIPYFLDTTPDWSCRGKMRRQIFPKCEDCYGDNFMGSLIKLGIDNMLNCVGLFCPFPIFCRLPFR